MRGWFATPSVSRAPASITRRRLGPIVGGLALVALLAANVSAAPIFSASASVNRHVEYLNDAVKVYTFTIHNTGNVRIGAVEIARPSLAWTIIGCPAGPPGWARIVISGRCRYGSAPGPGDDLQSGQTSSAFQVSAQVGGTLDSVRRWHVIISRSASFIDASTLRGASEQAPGLLTNAYAFEILDVFIRSSPLTPGSACPAATPANHRALTGTAGHVAVVCGRNHTTLTVTPVAARSSLAGTEVASHGAFTSGPIAPTGTSARVVLGNWANVQITSSPGTGKTVIARTGSSSTRTSPLTTLPGYEAVGQPPVVTTSGGSTAWTEGAAATAVDGGLTVTDGDDTNLESAQVRISSGFQAGDVLAYTGPISGSYNSGTGVLTLTGSDTVANYQSALRSVTFQTPNDDPAASRTVAFKANDGDSDSAEATKSIAITAVNDPPTVTTTAPNLVYTEGDGAAAVDSGLSITDPDSTNLSGGTVSITGNFASAEDSLAFTNQLGITGTYDSGTGVLTLTGTTTVANYVTALRTVTYTNSSEDPSTLTRTVSFKVNDGSDDSNTATRGITVGAVNDAPVVTTTGGSTPWTEGDPATVVDGGVTISDLDDTNIEGAQVRVSAGFQAGDVLGFADTGTISGSYASGTGILTLTGSDSLANYEAALSSITFETTNDNPGASKTVEFKVNDGTSDSNAPTRTIAITAVNDAPAITAPASVGADFDADQALNGISIADPDAGSGNVTFTLDANDGTLTFDLGVGGGIDSGDVTGNGTDSVTVVAPIGQIDTTLAATNGLVYHGTGGFLVTSDEVALHVDDGGNTGTGPAGTDDATITIEFNESPTADDKTTTTNEDTAVTVTLTGSDPESDPLTWIVVSGPADGTLYNGTSTAAPLITTFPTTLSANKVTYLPASNSTVTRSFGVKANDTHTDSNTATVTVNVTPVNDAPTVITSAGSLDYTEGDGPVAIDPGVSVDDVDDTMLVGASVWVSTCHPGQDILAFTDTSDITGSFTGVTCLLTLTGTASVLDYEAALQSVTYENPSDDPATAARTVTFRVDDGDTTGQATRGINLTATNDTPSDIALSNSTVAENQPSGTAVGTLSTTDADSADTHTYTLVAGSGDTDNASFQVNGSSLDTNQTFNFEAKSSYSIRVRSTDSGFPSAFREEAFTITITNVNEAPTDISLPDSNVDENQPVGTTVGTFSTTDVDAGDTFTYAIVSGLGDEDNASFTISGNELRTAATFDYEVKSTYFVRVRSTDSGGLFVAKSFSITVNDINDAPEPGADTYNGVGNNAIYAGTTRPSGTAGIVLAGISVLDNDTDQDGDPLHVEAVSGQATTAGGTVTIEADGNFTYFPQAGDTGLTDTFTYRLCDVSLCDTTTPDVNQTTGSVSVVLINQVWYVKNDAAPGGDGTSYAPFDTLAEAETASSVGDTAYVFDGNDSSTSLDTGYQLEANERLIGESTALTLDPDGAGPLDFINPPLFPGTPGASPTLTTTAAEDVVSLAAGATVDGFNIDPGGSGGGIGGGPGAGGPAASGVQIHNINIADTGTLGIQPGLELNGTTGTNVVSDLTVSNGGSAGAIGVSLTTAGTVSFPSAGAISITTTGAKALDVFGTNFATSVFDDITVTGSSTGGVSLVNTTGAVTFGDGIGTDLDLTTTSGSEPAFRLQGAGVVTVAAAGTDKIDATGGAAVDVSSATTPSLAFDSVSSTNSAGKGINLSGLGTGTFSATGGSISGAAVIAFDVDQGSGDITYPGNLNNGAGQAAEITNRSGGTITLSGSIADTSDAGGGILLSGNSGGSTVFSGSTKTINTTTPGSPSQNHAIVMDTSDGHTLTLSGGGLDIDTTTGKGLEADTSGTIVVSGTGNTITTTTGRALNIANTDIGVAGLTFQAISSNGAVNGVVLTNTGSSGGLTVTGTGAANSGGTIQNTTGAGIALTNTRDVSLSQVRILNTAGSGVSGTTVTNFSFVDGTIDGSGTGLAAQTSNLAFNTQVAGTENNLSGAVTITGNTLTNAYYHGVSIFNFAGTISDLNVSNNTITSSASTASSLGGGIQVVAFGSAGGVASITKATIDDNTIVNFPSGVGLQVQCGNANSEAAPASTCGTPGSGTNVIAITNNRINATLGWLAKTGAEGIIALVNGRGQGNFVISDNDVQQTTGTSISSSAFGDATVVETIAGNTVVSNNTVASQGIGIGTSTTGGFVTNTPHLTATISSNIVSFTDGNGILAVARDNATGQLDVTIANNTVAGPLSGVRQGIRIDAGNASGDNDVCLDISGNTSAPSVGQPAALGIGLRKQGTSTTANAFGIEGMAATASPGVEAFVDGQNPAGGGTLLISATSGFSSCSSAP